MLHFEFITPKLTATLVALSLGFAGSLGCSSEDDSAEVTDEVVTDDTVVDDTVADDTVADDGVTDDTVADDTVADDTTPAESTNPFQADWEMLANQATDNANLDQCVGFVDSTKTSYRVYDVTKPNANPKEGDVCPGAGNTAAGDGTCNVPCGFERGGEQIGNKGCTCAGGIIDDCSCSPLPGIFFPEPVSCDSIWDGYNDTLTESDGVTPLSFAKQMDEQPCGEAVGGSEFDTCITPDLPEACEWTTPKGCVCLFDTTGAAIWQCGSTNSWFACSGAGCPSTYTDAGVTNGDVKAWCNAGGNL